MRVSTRRMARKPAGFAIFTRFAVSAISAGRAKRRTKPVSSLVILQELDEPQRREALDPARSFTVRAPAGSGKTELLIHRFLRLLAIVDRPESIVAITFTRKAAGEMGDRIAAALTHARARTPVEKAHMEITRQLAQQALMRDQDLN